MIVKKPTGLVYLMAIFLFASCDKDDLLPFEKAAEIRENCRAEAYSDSLQIAENLVGNWELVGYGCGFCIPHDPPMAELTLGKNTGVLELTNYGEADTLHTFQWELERYNIGTESVGFRFRATPSQFTLHMRNFCKDYMFFDDSPVDGLFMLYEKQ